MGHDSSSSLVENGRVISDVAEERFNRLKHYCGLPVQSIKYCLGKNNLDEIDYIVIANKYGYMDNKLMTLLFGNHSSWLQQNIKNSFLSGFLTLAGLKKEVPPVYYEKYNLKDKSKIKFVDHHLAHAASAYYTQDNTGPMLLFVADGIGDGTSISVHVGDKGEIKTLKKYNRNGSLGWFYGLVTEGLHWWHGDGEGKTMGLAPYGNTSKTKGVLDDFYPHFKEGKIIKKFNLKNPSSWEEAGSVQYHFEEVKNIEKLVQEYGKENIAAEAQRVLEKEILDLVEFWVDKTGCRSVGFSGGVFLNVKLNQRIFEKIKLDKQHIFPNAGDFGLAVGAALYYYYKKVEFKGNILDSLYTGPDYNNLNLDDFFKSRNLKFEKSRNIEIDTAKLLSDNKIIGWFQGRMESGPRALGNRSILMSPLRAENKDIINAKVKFREGFRPFCPSLLHEKAGDYFENYRDEFFMITSFKVKEQKRDKIPAVVHVDGTARPQMVKKTFNQRFWNLINEFGNITGEYILLNTSFNVRGEPIVNTPNEALKCFFDGGLDVLIIDDYIIRK